mmetsp:Transcript_29714/g.91458  ORF Transcript_29714/g.91458 Transcript_29714/m.91458 type:complete len:230 (-) Transcript_29714:97-786(-)
MRSLTSWLFRSCLSVQLRTFRSFPRNGKMPMCPRPTAPMPATAKAFAESPSVRIKVHSAFPTLMASSSLVGMERPELSKLRRNCWRSASSEAAMAASKAPKSATRSAKSGGTERSKPRRGPVVVKRVFVCESKSGLSTKTLTTTRRKRRTVSRGTLVPCRCKASTAMLDASWSATVLTCVPLLHRMPFTKPSAAKPRLGSKAAASSARTRPPPSVMSASSRDAPSTMEA